MTENIERDVALLVRNPLTTSRTRFFSLFSVSNFGSVSIYCPANPKRYPWLDSSPFPCQGEQCSRKKRKVSNSTCAAQLAVSATEPYSQVSGSVCVKTHLFVKDQFTEFHKFLQSHSPLARFTKRSSWFYPSRCFQISSDLAAFWWFEMDVGNA